MPPTDPPKRRSSYVLPSQASVGNNSSPSFQPRSLSSEATPHSPVGNNPSSSFQPIPPSSQAILHGPVGNNPSSSFQPIPPSSQSTPLPSIAHTSRNSLHYNLALRSPSSNSSISSQSSLSRKQIWIHGIGQLDNSGNYGEGSFTNAELFQSSHSLIILLDKKVNNISRILEEHINAAITYNLYFKQNYDLLDNVYQRHLMNGLMYVLVSNSYHKESEDIFHQARRKMLNNISALKQKDNSVQEVLRLISIHIQNPIKTQDLSGIPGHSCIRAIRNLGSPIWVCQKEDEWSNNQIYFFASQCMKHIESIHRLGILHNDIHQGNIIVHNRRILNEVSYVKAEDGKLIRGNVQKPLIIDFGNQSFITDDLTKRTAHNKNPYYSIATFFFAKDNLDISTIKALLNPRKEGFLKINENVLEITEDILKAREKAVVLLSCYSHYLTNPIITEKLKQELENLNISPKKIDTYLQFTSLGARAIYHGRTTTIPDPKDEEGWQNLSNSIDFITTIDEETDVQSLSVVMTRSERIHVFYKPTVGKHFADLSTIADTAKAIIKHTHSCSLKPQSVPTIFIIELSQSEYVKQHKMDKLISLQILPVLLFTAGIIDYWMFSIYDSPCCTYQVKDEFSLLTAKYDDNIYNIFIKYRSEFESTEACIKERLKSIIIYHLYESDHTEKKEDLFTVLRNNMNEVIKQKFTTPGKREEDFAGRVNELLDVLKVTGDQALINQININQARQVLESIKNLDKRLASFRNICTSFRNFLEYVLRYSNDPNQLRQLSSNRYSTRN